MPYVKDNRTNAFGHIVFSGGGSLPAAGSAPSSWDAVYSFRTGKRASTGITGINPGDPNASLPDRLADRKKFFEQLGQSVSSREYAGAPKRYMRQDVGHEFITVKYRCSGSSYVRQSNGVTIRGRGLSLLGAPVSPAYLSWDNRTRTYQSFASTPYFRSETHPSVPVSLLSNRDINASFKNMAPGAADLPIAETLIELMSGNLPSIWKNLSQLRGRISDLKVLGKEHLNVQFGWTPIIKDLQRVIEALTGIDGAVYSSSDRRKRGLLPKFEYADTKNRSCSAKLARIGQTTGTSSSSPILYGDFHASTREDGIITARFTRARPSVVANSFVDRAAELHYNLGFQDPTLLWDLTSWSWLFDWALHLGDSVSNMNNFSKQSGVTPIDYAYLTTYTTCLMQFGGSKRVFGTEVHALSPISEVTLTKWRRPITPFGFGLDLDALSAFQMSILVALGLARSR